MQNLKRLEGDDDRKIRLSETLRAQCLARHAIFSPRNKARQGKETWRTLGS